MIAIVIGIVVVGAVYYSFEMGRMKGFRDGMDHADKAMDEELLKRWRKLQDENK